MMARLEKDKYHDTGRLIHFDVLDSLLQDDKQVDTGVTSKNEPAEGRKRVVASFLTN